MNEANENVPKTSSFSYRVVCERCHKTVFFLGNDHVEAIYVLCDECTLND
jgi:hypothetical protein